MIRIQMLLQLINVVKKIEIQCLVTNFTNFDSALSLSPCIVLALLYANCLGHREKKLSIQLKTLKEWVKQPKT